MAAVTRYPNLSRDDLITCCISSATAFTAVASAGIGIFLATDANGTMSWEMAIAIGVIPCIGTRLVKEYVLRRDMFAIYLGGVVGMSVPYLTDYSNLAFLAGSVVSGVVAAATSALLLPRRLK